MSTSNNNGKNWKKCYHARTDPRSISARTAVYEIDMDVDSLNDNADPYSATGFNDEEDRIEVSEKEENGVKKPGKIVIGIPHENFDFDIIPDYADAIIEERKFVPIKLHLKQPFKIDESTVKLEFEESKPNLAVAPAAGQPQVIPELSKGGLRLWKKTPIKPEKTPITSELASNINGQT